MLYIVYHIPRSETYQHFLFAYKIQFLIKSTLSLMMYMYAVALKRDMMAISYHIHSTIFWMMEFQFFCLLALLGSIRITAQTRFLLFSNNLHSQVNPQYRSRKFIHKFIFFGCLQFYYYIILSETILMLLYILTDIKALLNWNPYSCLPLLLYSIFTGRIFFCCSSCRGKLASSHTLFIYKRRE